LHDISVCGYCHIYQCACLLFFVFIFYIISIITTTATTTTTTAVELSLGGSSPYTSTDKTNKNKYTSTIQYKNSIQTIQKNNKYKTHGEKGDVYRALVGKPEGKGPLGRPRRRWENNIKMDLQEMRRGAMD
jgi:hypothetical protein